MSEDVKRFRMHSSEECGTEFLTKQSNIRATTNSLLREMVNSATQRTTHCRAETDPAAMGRLLYQYMVAEDRLVYSQEFQMTNTVVCSPNTFRLFRQSDLFVWNNFTGLTFVDHLTGIRSMGMFAGQWQVFVADGFPHDGSDELLMAVSPKRPLLWASDDGKTEYHGPERGMVVISLNWS